MIPTPELAKALRLAAHSKEVARHAADRLDALNEFVEAHDAVESLIADFTDDRAAYNVAVARFDAARRTIAAAGAAGDHHE